jgi:hypothetical protein
VAKKRALGFLLAALLALLSASCSSDKDKGINKDKDKPRAGDKTAVEPAEGR